MLDWLTRAADLLVGQAPGVAAELLTRAVASTPADSARQSWLASRLADALYRIGDRAAAEQVANRALEYATEPDVLVDLHWTLAQCRMLAGESAESLASLDRALAARNLGPAPRPAAGARRADAPATAVRSNRPAGSPPTRSRRRRRRATTGRWAGRCS